jgi:hypothetical protein
VLSVKSTTKEQVINYRYHIKKTLTKNEVDFCCCISKLKIDILKIMIAIELDVGLNCHRKKGRNIQNDKAKHWRCIFKFY